MGVVFLDNKQIDDYLLLLDKTRPLLDQTRLFS